MIIRDPVHGLIDFAGPAQAVVEDLLDTKEVQRLRRVRQLGVASLAFPGAEHTRFGHSLGAAYVMVRLCQKLRAQSHIPDAIPDELFAAATAAALLHDVGHPPLSHLLESALVDDDGHEEWSLRIIRSKKTEVGKVLDRHGLRNSVGRLLAKTHRATYLCDALSSALDVDRFDYLLRDSHHSGVRYGIFDLDWMLSSLLLAEAPREGVRRTVLAVDGRRGLRAVEGYLMARLSMFQQVYFHKTGRAAEFMLKQALKRISHRVDEPSSQPLPKALRKLLLGKRPPLDEYLELDDHLLWTCVRQWSKSSDPVLSRLSDGLLNRRLLRTLPSSRGAEGDESEMMERVKKATFLAGFDPEYFCGVDRAIDVPYHVDPGTPEKIWVVGLGRPGPLAEVSPLVEVLKGWQVGRTIVICPQEARESVIS